MATTGLVVTNNHVHDNHGYGLWTFEDNIGTYYAGNVVENNYMTGIKHYHSYQVTIEGNTLRNNGTSATTPPGTGTKYAAVQVTGPDATVRDNLIENNHNGVVVIGYNPGSGLHGSLAPVRTSVTGNTIIASGNTGLSVPPEDDAGVLSTAVFDHNDYYHSDTAAKWWIWGVPLTTWDNWQGYGLDLNGSLSSL